MMEKEKEGVKIINNVNRCQHPAEELRLVAFDRGQAMLVCNVCDANVYKALKKEF